MRTWTLSDVKHLKNEVGGRVDSLFDLLEEFIEVKDAMND